MKKLIIYACLLLIATGCMKDLGNYQYTDLNRVTITGIDSLYTIEQMDTLKMNPQVTFSLGNQDELTYEWQINYKVISDQRTLNKPIGTNFGKWPASLTVTNKKSRLQYFYDFNVEILNPYGRGLFVLSEKEDGNAMLSFQRRSPKIGLFKEDVFAYTNSQFGELGKKPIQLQYDRPDLYVVCKEGDKKITVINSDNMKLVKTINENVVVGGYSGNFAPAYLQIFHSGTGIVSDGKFFIYDAGRSEALYRPVEGNYSLANYITANFSLAAYYMIGYDKEKCRFISFSPEANLYYYSKIKQWPSSGNASTDNMTFVAGAEYGDPDWGDPLYTQKKKIILYSSNDLHFFELQLWKGEKDPDTGRPSPGLSLSKTMSISGIGNEKSTCILGQNTSYWFIATENKIYRVYANGGEAELWYTLDRGTVKAMTIDNNERTLFVAASVSSGGKKSGDILVINATQKNTLIEPVYRDACKEPVSLVIKER